MSRRWYVSPVRVRPGFYIPGRFNSSDGYWMGPSIGHDDWKGDMGQVRGPFPTAKEAAEAARVWREDEGKHSDIWLCLVEGDYNEVTHCNKYDPEGYEPGKRVEVSEEERRARATGEAAAQEMALLESERLANMFKAIGDAMEGKSIPPFKIERRPRPPWSPYGSQMVEIPLSPIRGARFDLIERAQALAMAQGYGKDRNPDGCEIPAFVLSANPCDDTVYTILDHHHDFQRGGKCSRCDVWCPHPVFEDDTSGRPTCTTCGCLKPLNGSPDFYELALGDVQPYLLGTYKPEE